MVHDNLPAGVIITNGLGGSYQTWILAQFHLFLGFGGSPSFAEVGITIRGGTGSTYQPRYYPPRDYEDDDEVVWKPREDEEFEVIITARVGSRDIKRHYFVKKRTQVVMTQVLNFLNTTRSRMSVAAGTLTKTAKDIAIRIRNIGKKS